MRPPTPGEPAPDPPATSTAAAAVVAGDAAPATDEPDARTSFSARIAHALGWLNLYYLGALPSLATFTVVARHGTPISFGFVLVGGIFGIVIYLAVLFAFTALHDSPWTALLVLVDGPVLAYLSLPPHAGLPSLAIQAFLVDGTAVFLAIGVLAAVGSDIDPGQRVGSIVLVLMALGFVAALFWHHLSHDLGPHPVDLALLAGAIVWSTIAHVRVMAGREPVADTSGDAQTPFILILVPLWAISLMLGLSYY